jgi:hypothetical protein
MHPHGLISMCLYRRSEGMFSGKSINRFHAAPLYVFTYDTPFDGVSSARPHRCCGRSRVAACRLPAGPDARGCVFSILIGLSKP